MNAARLRRAADLMRSRAEAATSGPWALVDDDHRGFYNPSVSTTGSIRETTDGSWIAECGPASINGVPDAEHIASWHPTVALAVAAWIDCHAADLERAGGHTPSCDSPGDVEYALEVADAYLGADA